LKNCFPPVVEVTVLSLQGSIFSLHASIVSVHGSILTLMRIQIQLFTLMEIQIWIQLAKIMLDLRTWPDQTGTDPQLLDFGSLGTLPKVLDIDHRWLKRASHLVIGWHGPGKLEAANQKLGENFENPGIEQENVSRYLRCTDKDRRSQLKYLILYSCFQGVDFLWVMPTKIIQFSKTKNLKIK
jgi:hypothetical protein